MMKTNSNESAQQMTVAPIAVCNHPTENIWTNLFGVIIFGAMVWGSLLSSENSMRWFALVPGTALLITIRHGFFSEQMSTSEFDWTHKTLTVHRTLRGKHSSTSIFRVGDIRAIRWHTESVTVKLPKSKWLQYTVENLNCNNAKNPEELAKELGKVFKVPADKITFVDDSPTG